MKYFPSLKIKIVYVCLIALAASCGDDDEAVSSADTQTSESETISESITDELDDISSIALNSQETASGGRVRSVGDGRLDCEGTTIVFTNVNTEKTSGTATITFAPNGCTDPKGNVRKGKIVINWSGGRWFKPGSTQTLTLQDYSINGIGIGGTRSRTCTSASGTLSAFSIQWNILANHTISWPDQKTASRIVNKTMKWEHSPNENLLTVTTGPEGDLAAAGENRNGEEYAMEIETPLVYKSSCAGQSKVFLPVSGIKTLTRVSDGKSIAFDFGDGACDNTFTITVNGVSKTVTGKNDVGG